MILWYMYLIMYLTDWVNKQPMRRPVRENWALQRRTYQTVGRLYWKKPPDKNQPDWCDERMPPILSKRATLGHSTTQRHIQKFKS